MSNNVQLKQLEILRDKVYIYQVLTTKSNIWYSNLKQIINIPIILSSFALSILNSNSVSADEMKLPNIVINSIIGLMVSLINQFRIVEKQSSYKTLSQKFQNLLHEVEDKITNDNDITPDETRLLLKQYDEIISNMEFPIPERIANNVKKIYKGKKYLPVILISDQDDEPTKRSSRSNSSPVSSQSNDIIVVDLVGT
jgi:hypothetical protein